ncbi:MAG: CBS domain-containing protein [Thauera phenolivorans]|uniref:CBS domain-containing protein n=1 Tax=Thauera phenolivorans TaxID=1792543 RepID=A0A7X7R6V9_9RHOO|nr:CBS domain-containing protein [Thauera phenolivorans]NLF52946.1 CBS domain-containing protein [Thauera phenolivorans]
MPTRPLKEVIAEREFVCVSSDVPVREVSRRMLALNRSAALVTEHGVLTGIFTERDASFRVLAAGLDPDATPIGAVMTHNPQTLGADKPFGHALHLMYEGGYRHIPVVDRNRRPLGVVSARDALALDALDFGAELVRREEITVIL